jgi:hypothetical protein
MSHNYEPASEPLQAVVLKSRDVPVSGGGAGDNIGGGGEGALCAWTKPPRLPGNREDPVTRTYW